MNCVLRIFSAARVSVSSRVSSPNVSIACRCSAMSAARPAATASLTLRDRRPVRRICRNVIGHDQVRPAVAFREGLVDPVRLYTSNGRDVSAVQKEEAQVIAKVECAVGRLLVKSVEERRHSGRSSQRPEVAPEHA